MTGERQVPAGILRTVSVRSRVFLSNSDTSNKWIDVTLSVDGTNDSADLVVGPSGTKDYTTLKIGAVTLFYNSQPVRQAANGGTACPP
jgi:hypothetical protein